MKLLMLEYLVSLVLSMKTKKIVVFIVMILLLLNIVKPLVANYSSKYLNTYLFVLKIGFYVFAYEF